MGSMVAMVRKPAIWLIPILFLGWTWFFRGNVSPLPHYVIGTGAAYVEVPGIRPQDTFATVCNVSDDGGRVTIGIHSGDFRWKSTRLEQWGTRTGAKLTPNLWSDSEWQQLLSRPSWHDSGLMTLLADSSGREFLTDESAWAALRERLALLRKKAFDDVSKTIRPVDDGEKSDLFPHSIYFGPDGELLAYVSHNGWPVHLVSESLGDGITIEKTQTGQRVAVIPGVTSGIFIAPGGQTAVIGNSLWDLKTTARRAELAVPDSQCRFGYSSDGRYVVGECTILPKREHRLQWWETSTGKQIGSVDSSWDKTLVDGGRVLVTHPPSSRRQAGLNESYKLCFWDVATGVQKGEWDLGTPS